VLEERRFDVVGFLRFWLPDDRVLELFEDVLRPLELRDAGGEDVRVAMATNLRDRHISHTLHTPTAFCRVCAGSARERFARADLGTEIASDPTSERWPNMATTTRYARPHVGTWERTHVARSRGAVSGILLVLLGIWGGLIPFVGPLFGYAYSPDRAWHFTMGILWLEILPAAAVVLGGLLLLSSANRVIAQLGGWLAALGGAWFVVGSTLSTLWTGGTPAAGVPAGPGTLQMAMERIGFFYGLGAVVMFLAAFALGRTSVVAVRDLRDESSPDDPRFDDADVDR
jgi:hypothetical protein